MNKQLLACMMVSLIRAQTEEIIFLTECSLDIGLFSDSGCTNRIGGQVFNPLIIDECIPYDSSTDTWFVGRRGVPDSLIHKCTTTEHKAISYSDSTCATKTGNVKAQWDDCFSQFGSDGNPTGNYIQVKLLSNEEFAIKSLTVISLTTALIAFVACYI